MAGCAEGSAGLTVSEAAKVEAMPETEGAAAASAGWAGAEGCLRILSANPRADEGVFTAAMAELGAGRVTAAAVEAKYRASTPGSRIWLFTAPPSSNTAESSSSSSSSSSVSVL